MTSYKQNLSSLTPIKSVSDQNLKGIDQNLKLKHLLLKYF